VPPDWSPRAVPDDLRARYWREGLWTDETLGDLLAGALDEHAGLQFRIWSRTRPFSSTLGAVYERARGLAAGLQARGIGPGDVLAFQLPNWWEAAATFWGASALGAVLVPVVHFYGPKELGFILRESQARVLITADRFGHLDYLAGLDTLRPTLPDLELVVVVPAESGAPAAADTLAFDDVADHAPLDAPLAVDPDAPAVVGYTSGTTSDPKGVVHSHRTLTAEVRQLLGIQAVDDRPMLVGAPVAHAIGMLAGLLGPPYRSQPVHLMDVWEPAAVLAAMVEADLTSGAGATFFCQSLLDAPGFGPEHVEHMRHIGLGGAAVPAAFADRAEGMGIGIARSYGSTEHPSTSGSTWETPREKRNHTDGRALAGVELRLVDDRGRDVETGAPGEIWSRGPELFTGYTDSALTKEAVDADGWYATGDIGMLDADGFLTITDRKKDIIIRGGENVSAAEVEELLARMPGVTEAAAVAGPDARLGEHVCAFVRVAPGAEPPDFAAVRHHLESAGLARQKWPEELHVVDDLPRTPSGKVKKFVLRELLRAEHQ
jgi:acyl-CoA synthetase (AMP-forming)/AMP-acid ligase II